MHHIGTLAFGKLIVGVIAGYALHIYTGRALTPVGLATVEVSQIGDKACVNFPNEQWHSLLPYENHMNLQVAFPAEVGGGACDVVIRTLEVTQYADEAAKELNQAGFDQ